VSLYATLNELKAALSITDAVDDTQLTTALTAASRWVDGYCGRTFGTAAGTASRDYIPTGTYEPLYIDDATSIVEVKVDDDLDGTFATTLTAADYEAQPVNATASGLAYPYSRLLPIQNGYWTVWGKQATVRVSATYGWAAVPAEVNFATVLQASRLFKRLDAPLGVMGFGDMGVVRVSRYVDPDVEQMLAPFRRRVYL
jgi:hypothetical protein